MKKQYLCLIIMGFALVNLLASVLKLSFAWAGIAYWALVSAYWLWVSIYWGKSKR